MHIVTDDGRECRVPYALLSHALGTPRQHVQSRTDTLRAQWQAGDQVQTGQGLVVMEAMKMENELRAQASGRVKIVVVSPGTAVEKGTVLLEME